MPLPNMVGAIGSGLRNAGIGSGPYLCHLCKLDVRVHVRRLDWLAMALPPTTDLAEQSESTIEIYGTDDKKHRYRYI